MLTPVLPSWNFENFKIVLTFDNNLKYEATTGSKDDNILMELNIDEVDAITNSNPVGIVTPNACSFKILDYTLNLIPTNSVSPYFGYLRNGVMVELFVSYDNDVTWTPYGVFFTTGWSATKEAGGYGLVELSCTDLLDYIGNLDVPQLSAYISTDVKVLLVDIFTKVGLNSNQYYIDPSLSLRMLFSITRGDKLKEVLNTIAQALVARIICNRRGVIEVRPAFPDTITPVYKLDADSDYLENMNLSLNEDALYNNVKLNYNKVDNQPSTLLLSLTNVPIKSGVNSFKNYFRDLAVTQNIISVDNVSITLDPGIDYTSGGISYVQYKASQGAIDLQINSIFTKTVYANIDVYGQPAGTTEAFVESGVKDRDAKIGNTLMLESYIIQDEDVAQAYVNKVSDYLYKMQQRYYASGVISPILETGQCIEITSTDTTLVGLYIITNIKISLGDSIYNSDLTLVKVRV